MDDGLKTVLVVLKWVCIGLVGLVFGFGSWFVVSPGEVGVSYSRLSGETQSHSQGAHFKAPLLTGVEKFDVQTQRLDIKSESASKDLQKVDVESALNYHLQYDKVNELFVKVGVDYVQKVIEPAVNEAIKAATARLPVEDIIVKREELKTEAESLLSKRLADYNITLESINLVDIKFHDDFNRVVEEKQMEEQKIKTAHYQRLQAEEKKKQTILEAEADAERQRLMRVNVTRDIVALKWIEKWDGSLPVTMVGDKGAMLMIQPEKKGE